MPRRLLLAAEIVLDVADTLPEADRRRLEPVAAALRASARTIAAADNRDLDFSPAMDRLRPSIRRLAAALDPDVPQRIDPARAAYETH